MRRKLALLLSATLWSCGGGGGSPTRPTAAAPSPTPAPLQLRDALTGELVTAEVSERPGSIVVSTPGYLLRESSHRGLVTLWSTLQRPGYWMPESYVRQALYDWKTTAGASGWLLRWTRPIVLSPAPGLEGDEEVMGVLRRVEAVLQALPLSVTVSVADSGGNVSFEIGEPVVENALASCSYSVSNHAVTRARLVFRERRILLGGPPRYNTPLHEVGHALGIIGHSDRVTDLMHTDGARTPEWVFSGDETALLTMMYQFRQPGNMPPDRDPDLGPARARGERFALACRG